MNKDDDIMSFRYDFNIDPNEIPIPRGRQLSAKRVQSDMNAINSFLKQLFLWKPKWYQWRWKHIKQRRFLRGITTISGMTDGDDVNTGLDNDMWDKP